MFSRDNLKLCKNEQNVVECIVCVQFGSNCWWYRKMCSASAGGCVCDCVCVWVRWKVFDVYALYGMQLLCRDHHHNGRGICTDISDDAHAWLWLYPHGVAPEAALDSSSHFSGPGPSTPAWFIRSAMLFSRSSMRLPMSSMRVIIWSDMVWNLSCTFCKRFCTW